MSEYIDNLKHSFAPHIDNANALGERLSRVWNEALEGIRDTLNKLPHRAFQISDYDPDFFITLAEGKTIRVTAIFLSENDIVLTDDDDWNYWEQDKDDWIHCSVVIFQTLTQCIQSKIHDFEDIRVGSIVRWNNPGIEDYDEADREEILNLQWVVDKIPEDFEEDSVICISNEYSEVEVLPWELVLEKV